MKTNHHWKANYFTILAGQAISLITSAVLQMAIIFYITNKTGSASMLSLASLMGFLPYAVLGPFIGVLIDRHDKKRIMIGADIAIAAAGGLLAIVSLHGELPITLILCVLFLRSVGTAFHTPALSAVTPLLLPQEQLVKYNGYSQSLQSLSYIISPALGALLYASWPMNSIIFIDVIGAVVASLSVLYVPIPKAAKQRTNTGSILFEMREGVAVLRKNRGLLALLLVGSLYMLLYMPINALYPLMSMGYFQGTPMHASVTEIAYAFGMMAGGFLLGVWGGLKRKVITIFFSILLMGASIMVSGFLPTGGYAFFVVCCFAMGFSVPFYSGVQTALFQLRIEPQYLGRVFSLSGSLISLSIPIGLGLSGLFADRIGVSLWFLLSGILIAAIASLCLVIPAIRGLDEEQSEQRAI